MNERKLKKVRREIESLRNASANIRPNKLVRVAESLGRRSSVRGKEPTYVSEPFSDLRPISIPGHSKALKRFTAENILDQLDEDCVRWEEEFAKKPKADNDE
jgi:hypothetical protein